MAISYASEHKLFFLVNQCPGPFRLVAGWVHMLEEHGNRLDIDLTVKPVEEGIKLLGHDREFKIPFEVRLMGATTKYGHGLEESRNVRLLGRFLIPQGVQIYEGHPNGYVDALTAAPELNKWQWEVVFNPTSRKIGFVAKLLTPLPDEWTM